MIKYSTHLSSVLLKRIYFNKKKSALKFLLGCKKIIKPDIKKS